MILYDEIRQVFLLEFLQSLTDVVPRPESEFYPQHTEQFLIPFVVASW